MNNKASQEQHTQLEVKIMGRLFRMACQPEERAALAKAVHILESKMQAIRNSGRVVGLDNMAILAALQIAHESLVGNPLAQAPAEALLQPDHSALAGKVDAIQALAQQALAQHGLTADERPQGEPSQHELSQHELTERAAIAAPAAQAEQPQKKANIKTAVQQAQLFD